jgi:hypothetical protein
VRLRAILKPIISTRAEIDLLHISNVPSRNPKLSTPLNSANITAIVKWVTISRAQAGAVDATFCNVDHHISFSYVIFSLRCLNSSPRAGW